MLHRDSSRLVAVKVNCQRGGGTNASSLCTIATAMARIGVYPPRRDKEEVEVVVPGDRGIWRRLGVGFCFFAWSYVVSFWTSLCIK